MSNKPYADLHLHVHMRSYNNVATDKYRDTRHYHPWTVDAGNLKKQRKGKRAFTYNQSNLVLCTNSNTRLVFNCLYPIEQGFFLGSHLGDRELNAVIDHMVKHDWLNLIVNGLGIVFKNKLNDPAVRLALQAKLMKIPPSRAEYFASKEYDYWQELNIERDFILHNSGIERESEVLGENWASRQWNKKFGSSDYKRNTEARGKYTICNSGSDVEFVLNQPSGIAMVLTIEGAHVLSNDKLNLNLPNHREIVRERIEILRNWKYSRIFFITIGHHFDNRISGHAKSLPPPSDILMDQRSRMDEGLTSFGEQCLADMLGIHLNAAGSYTQNPEITGNNILLDLKHSSALTRSNIYERIYSKLPIESYPPLVYSHMGYSGIDSLADLIALNNPTSDGTFNNRWNINMCNEDLYWAVKSKGLIGLSLDQRVCGIDTKEEEQRHDLEKEMAGISADSFWHNLKGMIDGIIHYPGLTNNEKLSLWDLFCLGSDYDGYIDPLNNYATVLDFPTLESDLAKKIRHFIFEPGLESMYLVPIGSTPESLARKICFDNARDFVVRNF